MNIVIVGHGPSLVKQKIGKQIDEFLYVIKVNKGSFPSLTENDIEHVWNYGTKCDAACYILNHRSTNEFINNMNECWVVPSSYHKRSKPIEWWNDLKLFETKLKVLAIHSYTAFNYWQIRYENRSTIYGRKKKLSTGLGAIIIAMEHYRPRRIALAGMDNMKFGRTSKPDNMGPKNPHPPDIEKVILEEIQEYYDCDVYHIT